MTGISLQNARWLISSNFGQRKASLIIRNFGILHNTSQLPI